MCRYCCGTDCYGAQRETTAHTLQESLVAYRCPWHAAVQQWILVPCLSKAKLPQQQTTAVASVRAENMMRVASGELHWFRSRLAGGLPYPGSLLVGTSGQGYILVPGAVLQIRGAVNPSCRKELNASCGISSRRKAMCCNYCMLKQQGYHEPRWHSDTATINKTTVAWACTVRAKMSGVQQFHPSRQTSTLPLTCLSLTRYY